MPRLYPVALLPHVSSSPTIDFVFLHWVTVIACKFQVSSAVSVFMPTCRPFVDYLQIPDNMPLLRAHKLMSKQTDLTRALRCTTQETDRAGKREVSFVIGDVTMARNYSIVSHPEHTAM